MDQNRFWKTPLNLRQLADTLRASKTTVSRALSGYSDVSPVTRERVREGGGRYGYAPSATARKLAMGRVETVGMILPGGTGTISTIRSSSD